MKKIKIFQQPFANIDDDFFKKFTLLTGEINIISFIKKSAFEDFDLYLNTSESLDKFDYYLEDNFYKNRSEWLKEKMRHKMKECKKEDN